jgi:hypothetical protein
LKAVETATDFLLMSKSQRLPSRFSVNDVPIAARELFQQLCDRYELAEVKWDSSDAKTPSNDRRISNQKLKAEGYQFIHPKVEV